MHWKKISYISIKLLRNMQLTIITIYRSAQIDNLFNRFCIDVIDSVYKKIINEFVVVHYYFV